MANWTGPDPNRLLPGEPWSSDLALAAFEDPVAIAEGAPGAPRLYGKAAVPPPQRSEMAVLTGLTPAQQPLIDELHYSGAFTPDGTSSTSYVSLGIITNVLMSGTVRFRARHMNDGFAQSTIRILKNGVEVQVWTVIGEDESAIRYVDIAVVPGDTIEWQHRVSSGAGTVQTVSLSVSASDAYVRIGIPIKASDL